MPLLLALVTPVTASVPSGPCGSRAAQFRSPAVCKPLIDNKSLRPVLAPAPQPKRLMPSAGPGGYSTNWLGFRIVAALGGLDDVDHTQPKRTLLLA